ncbi:hypothetical protein AAG570_013597 [Ranatra chinensis]|uniref:Uncharacterized protein n=1 Tax=Ranatra chinensis TaxID=642074 RepID=A0ABD0YCN4_9HEMI
MKSKLEQEAMSAQARLHRLQLSTTAHHWLHEHYLIGSPHPPISRAVFMLELRKTTSTLMALQPKIKEALDQQKTLIASAEQRLKWAAGANPALSEVMSAFESCVTSHKEKLTAEQNFATFVANMCSSVLQHEALRTPTTEALTNDSAFARLVEECEKSYYLGAKNKVNITPAEEGLVALLPPRKNIDMDWINKAGELISGIY